MQSIVTILCNINGRMVIAISIIIKSYDVEYLNVILGRRFPRITYSLIPYLYFDFLSMVILSNNNFNVDLSSVEKPSVIFSLYVDFSDT